MKSRNSFAAIILIIMSFCNCSIPWANGEVDTAWFSTYNGPENGHDYAHALCIDQNGSIYIAGQSTYLSAPGADIVILKYAYDGSLIWARHYEGPGDGYDEACSIQIDGFGNVYVAGRNIESSTDIDFVMLKYDHSGQLLWERRFGGPDVDIPFAMVVADAGDMYVTGYAQSNEGTFILLKYNPDGDLLWQRRYFGSGDGAGKGRSVLFDVSGNVIVTGENNNQNNHFGIVALKYDTAGVLLWEKRYEGAEETNNWPNDMQADYEGNIYITGFSLDNEPNAADYVTIKINSLGDLQWARLYDATMSSADVAEAIDIDAGGNVYVTGYSNESETGADYLTIKYDQHGTVVWERRYNGPGNGTDWAVDLRVDRAENIILTGSSDSDGMFEDYCTLVYDSAGNLLTELRYNGTSNVYDIPSNLQVDTAGNIIVTGRSWGGDSSKFNIATIKYLRCLDIDNDGICDTIDNCPMVLNRMQEDANEDGAGDSCDVCTDYDDDGFGNPGFPLNACLVDNCPFDHNPDQSNTDGDEWGDVCDDDDDNDGVLDADDNCLLIANYEQDNNDGDEFGDACDSDDDNDGVLDETDNCQYAANSGQEDNDGDGFGNACDPCDCTYFCDLDLNGSITPVDVIIIVNYVYRQLDSRSALPTACPRQNGDWDCFGGINPSDVAWYVNYVYRQKGDGPCNPCAE
jgi:uncharacterized delta-60 repeat protein